MGEIDREGYVNVAVLGCGALGSRIAYELASPSVKLILFDNQKVTEENLGTSLYTRTHIGKLKITALAQLIASKGYETVPGEKDDITNHGFLAGWDLVVDTLDNAVARNWASECGKSVCHVGVGQGFGEVSWGRVEYKAETGQPICTHQLGIPIIALTSAVAFVAIMEFLYAGTQARFLINENGKVMRG